MTEYDKWTVAALAAELESRGERAGKKKAAMVSRLEELDRQRQKKKKRPREDDARTLDEVDGAAAELICAITQDLPVNPVTAALTLRTFSSMSTTSTSTHTALTTRTLVR